MRSSLLALLALLGCASPAPLPVVDAVDLQRYAGRWYVWARFDHTFERGCSCSVAEYTVMPDYVKVMNYCLEGGSWRTIEGKAFPVEGSNNAKLKVQFFWPFKGDYYIIALDSTYQHVLVGEPGRSYLWMMSRTPQVDESVYTSLVKEAEAKGFDTKKLMRTTCATAPEVKTND
jgi:apolipoprotein D and lipocalin family protein